MRPGAVGTMRSVFQDSLDRVFVIVNGILMIPLLVCIVRSSRSPADREYLPGFLLVGVGLVSLTLCQLHIIPREWWFAVKSSSLAVGIWGGVLMERLWRSRRSSGDGPS
jgi:hypothetical protein